MKYPNDAGLVGGKFGAGSEFKHQHINQIFDEILAVIASNSAAVPSSSNLHQLLDAIRAMITESRSTPEGVHANAAILNGLGVNAAGALTYNGNDVDTVIAQRDVLNVLNSLDSTVSLSAAQGKVLKDLIDALQVSLDNLPAAADGLTANQENQINQIPALEEKTASIEIQTHRSFHRVAGVDIKLLDEVPTSAEILANPAGFINRVNSGSSLSRKYILFAALSNRDVTGIRIILTDDSGEVYNTFTNFHKVTNNGRYSFYMIGRAADSYTQVRLSGNTTISPEAQTTDSIDHIWNGELNPDSVTEALGNLRDLGINPTNIFYGNHAQTEVKLDDFILSTDNKIYRGSAGQAGGLVWVEFLDLNANSESRNTILSKLMSLTNAERRSLGIINAVEGSFGLPNQGNDISFAVNPTGLTVYTAPNGEKAFIAVDNAGNNVIVSENSELSLNTPYHLPNQNRNPAGIAVYNDKLLIADGASNKVFAYNIIVSNSTISFSRSAADDIDTLIAAGNQSPAGLAIIGDILLVGDYTDDDIRTYDLTNDGQHTPENDITNLSSRNGNILGVATDGITVWGSDATSNEIFAYDWQTKAQTHLSINPQTSSLRQIAYYDNDLYVISTGNGRDVKAFSTEIRANDRYTGLLDTPDELGKTGQIPAVNADRTALEFVDNEGYNDEPLTQAIAAKQDQLTAGPNINIDDGVISATGGSGSNSGFTAYTNLPLESGGTHHPAEFAQIVITSVADSNGEHCKITITPNDVPAQGRRKYGDSAGRAGAFSISVDATRIFQEAPLNIQSIEYSLSAVIEGGQKGEKGERGTDGHGGAFVWTNIDHIANDTVESSLPNSNQVTNPGNISFNAFRVPKNFTKLYIESHQQGVASPAITTVELNNVGQITDGAIYSNHHPTASTTVRTFSVVFKAVAGEDYWLVGQYSTEPVTLISWARQSEVSGAMSGLRIVDTGISDISINRLMGTHIDGLAEAKGFNYSYYRDGVVYNLVGFFMDGDVGEIEFSSDNIADRIRFNFNTQTASVAVGSHSTQRNLFLLT